MSGRVLSCLSCCAADAAPAAAGRGAVGHRQHRRGAGGAGGGHLRCAPLRVYNPKTVVNLVLHSDTAMPPCSRCLGWHR